MFIRKAVARTLNTPFFFRGASSMASTAKALGLKTPSLLQAGSFIGNEVVAGDAEEVHIVNPATGTSLTTLKAVSHAQVSRAIADSAVAFQTWRKEPLAKRVEVMKKWHSLVLQNADDLALLMTLENGKPLKEAHGEVMYTASYLEWFAEEAKRNDGTIIANSTNDKRLLVVRQPVGLVAAITPWNFPLAMLGRKMAPAIVSGCTMVAKPSEVTPLSAVALATLGKEAGLPPHVFNVVVGDAKSIGETFTSSKEVKKVTFTGSTRVGKLLTKASAESVKRVSMELGGNAPFIVFEDADVELAVKSLIAGKFRGCGQTCVSPNRVFVHSKIADEFYALLENKLLSMTVGNGLVDGVDIGPLINKDAVKKIHSFVLDAVKAGAKAKVGGFSLDMQEWGNVNETKENPIDKSSFYAPTLLTNCVPDMRAMREEIFGPIIASATFESDEQVLRWANDTDMGLASYIFTKDIRRVFWASEELAFGMVGVNEGIISSAAAPFGGVKESGYGREGSKYGLDDYTHMKYLCLGNMA